MVQSGLRGGHKFVETKQSSKKIAKKFCVSLAVCDLKRYLVEIGSYVVQVAITK